MIAVVDAGLGNLRSVAKALEATGTLQPVRVTSDPAVVRDAAYVVVPGQGAFGDCASA
ncbi:MAG: hisH, partial [bacterium]|nr:hisH [bacterium]